MKIQLFLPVHKDILTRFENCQQVDITQLDNVPNATCTLVHIGNCYDFVQNGPELLDKAVSKLRYGGQLVIEGTDLIEVSYSIARDMIPVQDVQGLLFGGRYTCSTINDMANTLRGLNLRIVKNRL